MQKAKPIFVLWVDTHPSIKEYNNIEEALTKRLPDYHVLIISGRETKIDVFNSDNITPIEFEELKQIIHDATGKQTEVREVPLRTSE